MKQAERNYSFYDWKTTHRCVTQCARGVRMDDALECHDIVQCDPVSPLKNTVY